MEGARILVAEDDRGVREALERALRFEGYRVEVAADGAQALQAVDRGRPDLVLLDVMMPHVDGLAVCRTLRARGVDLPILILTARDAVADRVSGLEAGADDYVVKPFALDELLARIRALLRRSLGTAPGRLTVADMTLDPMSRKVSRGERAIELTKTEFDLLELLMANAGNVLHRDAIYDRIWGFDFATSSNSLDVYIGYLRRKVEAGGEARLIHTVRGVGYVVRENP